MSNCKCNQCGRPAEAGEFFHDAVLVRRLRTPCGKTSIKKNVSWEELEHHWDETMADFPCMQDMRGEPTPAAEASE
jgi:hypothetical protein